MNKSEHFMAGGWGGGGCRVRPKLNKFEHVGALCKRCRARTRPPQTVTTENITFPQLRWRAVIIKVCTLKTRRARLAILD